MHLTVVFCNNLSDTSLASIYYISNFKIDYVFFHVFQKPYDILTISLTYLKDIRKISARLLLRNFVFNPSTYIHHTLQPKFFEMFF